MTLLSKTTYFVITLMCGAIALGFGGFVSADDFIVEEDAGMLVEHSSSSDFIVEEDAGMLVEHSSSSDFIVEEDAGM